MSNRGSSKRSAGGDKISYNRNDILKEREKLKEKQWKEGVVALPEPSGAGHVFEGIQEMTALTKELYDQVQLLINATVNALESIEIDVAAMDEEAAKLFYSE